MNLVLTAAARLISLRRDSLLGSSVHGSGASLLLAHACVDDLWFGTCAGQRAVQHATPLCKGAPAHSRTHVPDACVGFGNNPRQLATSLFPKPQTLYDGNGDQCTSKDERVEEASLVSPCECITERRDSQLSKTSPKPYARVFLDAKWATSHSQETTT